MIYLDNASTTYPKPKDVIPFMCDYYASNGFSVGRGQYQQSLTVTHMVDETRSKLLKLFNAPYDRKIVFTSSATIALNMVLQGLEYGNSENIYITHFEHNSVLRILHQLEKRYNFKVHKLSVDKDTLEYDIDKIKLDFVKHKPSKIIMSHASNVCGVITPIEEICKMAKQYESEIIVDAAQTSGLLDIDLRKSPIDYLIFAGHKTLYASFGVSGFVVKQDSKLKPLLFGGTGIDSASLEMPKTIPEKFEAGSANMVSVASLNKSLDWINEISLEKIRAKETELMNYLLTCVRQYGNINTYYPTNHDNAVGILSCTFEGYASDNIGQILDQHGIATRTGLHCSPNAHRFLKTFPTGTVRFSLSYFNTKSDIDMLDKVLRIIAESS